MTKPALITLKLIVAASLDLRRCPQFAQRRALKDIQ
jgi:hypothetical protein